jgi:uncharacterized protein (DUF1330 family)
MPAYFVITYDISDPAAYATYNPGSNQVTALTVAKYGGEILAAGQHSIQQHGDARGMTAIFTFPSGEAARAWYADPEYASAKAIRLRSTTNIQAFVIEGLEPPNAKPSLLRRV